jgi:regulator of sigma E protease
MSFEPSSIAAFVLFIGILIFVHELGHFLAAKYFDIKVLKFSLGFGKPIIQFTYGETTYQIAILPLGGFVKMLGEMPGDEIPPEDARRAFTHVPVYQRAIVAVAGPLFNLVFPVLCFFAYYTLGPTVESPVVGMVELDSPAERAGLIPGDRIVEVEGDSIWSFEDLRAHIQRRPEQAVPLVVERDGQRRTLTVTPRSNQGEDGFGGRARQGLIGVGPMRLGTTLGVDGGWAARFGLETGDRVLAIDGQAIRQLGELESRLRTHGPKPIEIVVARPTPYAVGELLVGKREVPVRLRGVGPEHMARLRDVGVFLPEGFLRFLDPAGTAARAGLRPGDRVVSVDGQRVSLAPALIDALQTARGEPVPVVVSRGGEAVSVMLPTSPVVVKHGSTGKEQTFFDAGFGLGEQPRVQNTIFVWNPGGSLTEVAHVGLVDAVGASVEQTLKVIGGLSVAIGKLITGAIPSNNVGGIITLYQLAAQAAENGIFDYLLMLAMISVNIGLFNLLPIPLFDGGQLVFCAVEAIRRRPLSVRVREYAALVGLAVIALLFVFVFYNDIGRATATPFK